MHRAHLSRLAIPLAKSHSLNGIVSLGKVRSQLRHKGDDGLQQLAKTCSPLGLTLGSLAMQFPQSDSDGRGLRAGTTQCMPVEETVCLALRWVA